MHARLQALGPGGHCVGADSGALRAGRMRDSRRRWVRRSVPGLDRRAGPGDHRVAHRRPRRSAGRPVTRVAELWNQLTGADHDKLWHSSRSAIGDPGGELILALAEHAAEYAAFGIAL